MNFTEITNIFIAPSLAALLTFFLAKRKYKTEVTASEIDNVQEAIKIWKEMALDLKIELRESRESNELLSAQLQKVNRHLVACGCIKKTNE